MKYVLFNIAVAIIAGIGFLTNASAVTRTYDFTVTATSGPLLGQSSTGYFSFDDSIIPSGGGPVIGTKLLTDLVFVWNGFSYDEFSANTGNFIFDAFGEFSACFGNNAATGSCSAGQYSDDWYVLLFPGGSGDFNYATPSTVGVHGGTVTYAPAVVSGHIAQLIIQDVGSTVGGAYNSAPDGYSGGFSIQPIDPETYIGVTNFLSDTGLPMLWGTDVAPLVQGPSVFTSGFLYSGLPVQPFTYGTVNNGAVGAPFNANGAIGSIAGNTLTIESLGWAGLLSGSTEYILEPDLGTIQVNWVLPGDKPNDYLVSFQWSHLITADEDPTGAFVGLNTNWILEGIASVEPGNIAPRCSDAVPSINNIWPPNHTFMSVSVLGVTDPDGDTVTISIDSIFQDEPVDAFGDGSSAPDGSGIGSPTASIRAERSGHENGRIYHIGFTADDGHGGTCSEVVLVGVPFSENSTPEDEGSLYDSTVP